MVGFESVLMKYRMNLCDNYALAPGFAPPEGLNGGGYDTQSHKGVIAIAGHVVPHSTGAGLSDAHAVGRVSDCTENRGKFCIIIVCPKNTNCMTCVLRCALKQYKKTSMTHDQTRTSNTQY